MSLILSDLRLTATVSCTQQLYNKLQLWEELTFKDLNLIMSMLCSYRPNRDDVSFLICNIIILLYYGCTLHTSTTVKRDRTAEDTKRS